MGLKQFHVFFIALAILCMLGFGFWALGTSNDVVGFWGKVSGVVSTLIGFALIPYGVWFVRKSKSIIT